LAAIGDERQLRPAAGLAQVHRRGDGEVVAAERVGRVLIVQRLGGKGGPRPPHPTHHLHRVGVGPELIACAGAQLAELQIAGRIQRICCWSVHDAAA